MEPENKPEAGGEPPPDIDRGLAFAYGSEDTLAYEAPGEDHNLRAVGPYEIIGVLGQGGMGVVYKAEQTDPVRRLVALKLIKLGMDTRDVLARFELERRALAAMSHGTIAKVFEAGTTEQGQPYFVMEYVEGLSLTRYCDEHRLPLKERIELFQQVCAGVQHAHQKGVVHRDLKPGNILVAREDDGAVPKILDFGLAKATNSDIRAKTLVTERGRILGTPEYMAPEQAAFDDVSIDTRADIYSLGVILYELLSGELPFTSQELRAAGWLEVQRKLTQDEPPKPSTKLATHGRLAGELAQRRRTTLQGLARELRGDLDWIVLKAIAKEPERRYDSATELATDLGRHLADKPVLAGPPSARYRLRKLVRRHRRQLVAAAVVLVTLVVGVIATTWFAIQANANAERLGRRTEEFEMLALVERLRVVREKEKALYPAWPDVVELMYEWLDDGGPDVGRLREGLPRARTTLTALRSRSPTTEKEREASRRVQVRFPELETLRSRLSWRRSAQAVRDGGAASEPVLDAAVAERIAKELNELAWVRVNPDRQEFGQEAEGLALARLGLEKATGRERARLGNTLAWALFACGLDDDALTQSRAVADENRFGRSEYQVDLERLTRAVRAARDETGRSTVARLERQVGDLEAELAEWRLPTEADRFLHGTLTAFVRDVSAFLENEVEEVDRRLYWAEEVSELTIGRFQARWDEAREAIQMADGETASELYATQRIDLEPQMGLVPIGRNPKTKLWEFYHLRSAWDPTTEMDPASIPIPTHRDDGSLEVSSELGLVLVLAPGGTFLMGAQGTDPDGPNYDPGLVGNEVPVHEVTLAPFLISRYEMTQAQWARLSGGDSPSWHNEGRQLNGDPAPGGSTHPVESVTYPKCESLLRQHGLVLPTDARWEYGCRGGTSTPWSTGARPETLAGHANVVDRTAVRSYPSWGVGENFDDGWVATAPVGSYAANPFGLFDVHGNVYEWCRDGNGSDTPSRLEQNGARTEASTLFRIVRGGNYGDGARKARSASRVRFASSFHGGHLGVRPAREIYVP